MALRSEQARVLRRRVLGGLIRNLVLFTGAFALLCGAVQTFVVPSMADYVANSTSSWHTLPSSEQYTQALADEAQAAADEAQSIADNLQAAADEAQAAADEAALAELDADASDFDPEF